MPSAPQRTVTAGSMDARRATGRATRAVVVMVWLLLLTACATPPLLLPGPATAYDAAGNDDVFARYAPVIVPQDLRQSFNRIGRASARRDADGREVIYIDPAQPVYYVQRAEFTAGAHSYVNLIYRVHFERVPYSLWPFHLTAGNNGGLLVIVTLNDRQQPLLITTVHTCGCYLAIVPTSYLDRRAYPAGWPADTQPVFGETLPARLEYRAAFTPDQRLVIHLRSGTHRVMDVQVVPQALVAPNFQVIPAGIAPLDTLMQLPLGEATTSFYQSSGRSRGYVKNAHKPFEFLLMSWWALDPRVGRDKEYGPAGATGTVFYTSLKPWRRQASDMWPFGAFLEYWGWRL